MESKSVKMISLRDFTLTSRKGHCAIFEARVPRDVPRILVSEALAAGCALADLNDAPEFNEDAPLKIGFAPDMRKSMLFIAVSEIVARNDVKEFDGGGNPTVEAIKAIVGFDVSKKDALETYRILIAYKQDNQEYLLHEDAPKAIAVVRAATKAELLELAVENGFSEDVLKGKDIRGMRKFLLSKFAANIVD